MFNFILTSYSLFPTKVCSLSDELKLSILNLSVVLLIIMVFFSFLVIFVNIIENSNKKVLYVTSEQFISDFLNINKKDESGTNFNYIDSCGNYVF